jgi:hypothetical protein
VNLPPLAWFVGAEEEKDHSTAQIVVRGSNGNSQHRN